MARKRKSKKAKQYLKKIYNQDKYVLVDKQIVLWRRRGGVPNPPVSKFRKPHKIGHKHNIEAQFDIDKQREEKPANKRELLLSKLFGDSDE